MHSVESARSDSADFHAQRTTALLLKPELDGNPPRQSRADVAAKYDTRLPAHVSEAISGRLLFHCL